MSVESVIVAGAGGFGRETVEIVYALSDKGVPITVAGICDDDPQLQGTTVLGVPVIGPIDAIHDHPESSVVVTIGNSSDYHARKRIVGRLSLPTERYTTLIHPSCVVAESSRIGSGSILHANVVLTAEVRIGEHVAVMPGTIFTHDNHIGDYATFGSGVRLAGRVTVGEGSYVGAGALVREDLTIGAWSLVGMGSIVTRDIPPGEVWAGTPARRIRVAATPPDAALTT